MKFVIKRVKPSGSVLSTSIACGLEYVSGSFTVQHTDVNFNVTYTSITHVDNSVRLTADSTYVKPMLTDVAFGKLLLVQDYVDNPFYFAEDYVGRPAQFILPGSGAENLIFTEKFDYLVTESGDILTY